MSKKVAFIGSGEMARHIAHYMVEDNQFEIAGYYDDYIPAGSIVHSYPILGKLDDLVTQYKSGVFDELINAIGFTRMEYRIELFERFEKNIPFARFIHSSCLVDSTAKIGIGVVLFPGCVIDRNVSIKNNVFLHVGCIISHDSIICENSYLSPNTTTAGFVEIGEGCNIGVSTTISDRVKICNGVRTGAGTVVVRDITESGTYVGVPCRKIKNTI